MMMTAAGVKLARYVLRPALALVIVLIPLPSFDNEAFAQQVIRRQGLFDRLFGGPPPREALPPAPAQPPSTRAPQQRRRAVERQRPPASRAEPRARRAARPASEPAPAPPVAEKLENARTVLVVGDFLAAGLAEGLESAYSEAPGVRILDRSNGSSGFVRDDFYDWNAEIGPMLEELQPAVVVVMIGSNDRQQLVVDGRPARPQTEAWRKEYVRRVTSFAEKISATGIPLIWTGLPSFKSPSMSSDMLAFNDIYKHAAASVGGTFVDIWEGFVDENGAFITTGPDMNGQPVRLRGNDGINLTRAGRRKVAFYVEQPLSKLLGAAVEPDIGGKDIQNLPLPVPELGEPADLQRVGPISLAGPELDGGGELLGGTPLRPVENLSLPPARPGRADDFLLPGNSADLAEESPAAGVDTGQPAAP